MSTTPSASRTRRENSHVVPFMGSNRRIFVEFESDKKYPHPPQPTLFPFLLPTQSGWKLLCCRGEMILIKRRDSEAHSGLAAVNPSALEECGIPREGQTFETDPEEKGRPVCYQPSFTCDQAT